MRKKNWAIMVFGAIIILLLIVSITLSSIILARQGNDKDDGGSTTLQTTTIPVTSITKSSEAVTTPTPITTIPVTSITKSSEAATTPTPITTIPVTSITKSSEAVTTPTPITTIPVTSITKSSEAVTTPTPITTIPVTSITKSSEAVTTPTPTVKPIVFMFDTSSAINQTVLENEVNFASQYLIESLRKEYVDKYPNQAIKVAAIGCPDNSRSENLFFYDLNDSAKIDDIFASVKKLHPENTLEISKSLNFVREILQDNIYRNAKILLTAADTGVNFNEAIETASKMKENGDQIVVMSLTQNTAAFDKLSSNGKAINAMSIVEFNSTVMKELSSNVIEVISTPPSPSSSSTSSTISTVTVTIPSTDSTSMTDTQMPIPESYRIDILVQASSSITQQNLIHMANFVYNNLITKLRSKDKRQSLVRIVPYAFDLSPDCEEYVPLNERENPTLKQQYQTTKLSKITTFMSQLDKLFLGQVFNGLRDSDDGYPSHVVTLLTEKGNSFNDAVNYVNKYKHRTQFITVTTNPHVEEFQDVSSTKDDVIIITAFHDNNVLDGTAEKIAARIFPNMQRKHKEALKHIVTASTATATTESTKITTVDTSGTNGWIRANDNEVNYMDLIILLDASINSTTADSKLSKQASFANALSKKLLADVSNNNSPKRIAIAPYALYLDADAVLESAQDETIDRQTKAAQRAVITTFPNMVNQLNLASTLQTLIASPLLNDKASTNLVLLVSMASDDLGSALIYVKNITNSGRKLVTVVLDGNVKNFDESFMAVNGSAVLRSDEEKKSELINDISKKLNTNDKEDEASENMSAYLQVNLKKLPKRLLMSSS